MSVVIESVTYDWCFENVSDLYVVFIKVAKSDGSLETEDWLDHPDFLKLHPSFVQKLKGGSPVVSRWARQHPESSGLIFVRYLSDSNSLWQLGPELMKMKLVHEATDALRRAHDLVIAGKMDEAKLEITRARGTVDRYLEMKQTAHG